MSRNSENYVANKMTTVEFRFGFPYSLVNAEFEIMLLKIRIENKMPTYILSFVSRICTQSGKYVLSIV